MWSVVCFSSGRVYIIFLWYICNFVCFHVCGVVLCLTTTDSNNSRPRSLAPSYTHPVRVGCTYSIISLNLPKL